VLARIDIERRHDLGLDPADLGEAVAARLRVRPEAVGRVEIVRQALDARARRRAPTWRLTLDVELRGRGRPSRGLRPAPPPPPRLESPPLPAGAGPVVVVGAGPAGLFCAWHLAERGARVRLLERGKPVETRARDFGRFRGRGELDPESNICFGEGGAGTYSDGKLYTRKKDPLIPEVLRRMVECGAPRAIQVDAKPHIGTNKLFRMLKGLRAELEALGVELRFGAKVVGLRRSGDRVTGVRLASGEVVDASAVVLAIGHSARDTFEVLEATGVPMAPKPFAVGVRAEHPQPLIDAGQYGLPRTLARGARPATLPPADYRLTAQTEGDRGVWSFCMCPGGMIIPTSTEPEMVVVNGMSSARRSTPFANSGLVAHVGLDDLEREGFGAGPLAGVEFQRALERRAFRAGGGGYHAPAMRAADLAAGRASGGLADTHFRPGLTPTDLRDVLPAFVWRGLREALARFDRKIPGYASADANLIAVESRTSSPVRIPRDPETHEVPGFAGLHVAGEGPGHAGGIMSAAIDGLRTARGLRLST
jgi:hypothetical protein